MKAAIFRSNSGSFLVQHPQISGKPRLSVSIPVRTIRRCASESDIVRFEVKAISRIGSRSFPVTPRIPEEEDFDLPSAGILSEELCFPGGGNRNSTSGGGGNWNDGEDEDGCQIEAYYQDLLKTDPMNSLILGNYAKYLHEVEKDVVKAEEYYGRAILANPRDGEVLSLYAKLIWETQRDQTRAQFYYDQAVLASPDDSSVLGSYALFLWESEEDEEEEEQSSVNEQLLHSASAVKAF